MAPPLMSGDANKVTLLVGEEGNVWSEMRLKRREFMAQMRVTIFSSVSTNAHRSLSTRGKIGREKCSQLVILKRSDDKLSMAFRSAARPKKAQQTWVNTSGKS
jgi:hypothetical protein